MLTISKNKNSICSDVAKMQQLLKNWGYQINVTGLFDTVSDALIKDYQAKKVLGVDGIVGPKTWEALSKPVTKMAAMAKPEVPLRKLTEDDYARAAKMLNVPVAAVKAVKEVESGRTSGFSAPEAPVILFEGHIFWKQLKAQGIDPNKYVRNYNDIVYQSWTTKFYKSGLAEYNRLTRAQSINNTAALCSASWGLFQIMGFNYNLCGCADVLEFVKKMMESEGSQLDLFVKFILANKWDSYLRKQDWAGFARRYNGPQYAQNKYDKKLLAAYNKYK